MCRVKTDMDKTKSPSFQTKDAVVEAPQPKASDAAWAYNNTVDMAVSSPSVLGFYSIAEQIYVDRKVEALTTALATSNPEAFRKAAMTLLAGMIGDSVVFTEAVKMKFMKELSKNSEFELSVRFNRALKDAQSGTLAIMAAATRILAPEINIDAGKGAVNVVGRVNQVVGDDGEK